MATTTASITTAAASIASTTAAVTTTTAASTATAAVFGVGAAGVRDRVRNQHGGCRQHPTNGKSKDRLFELHKYLHLLVLVIEPQTKPVQIEDHCPQGNRNLSTSRLGTENSLWPQNAT
ncbi:hypothetical protein [Pseudomonas sp. NPDC090201]|uniref:hypothetical protein n=1 Tax=Pseudomonas sp. NPDC090201 TaxID=3364475 RepID=UPI0037F4717B